MARGVQDRGGSHGDARIASGARIAYSIVGEPGPNPPLLLNRPLGGSMALWGEFAERLATAFQVIAFDPRGVGSSSDVPLLHTTRAMARDAVGLLDALRVERAHVFGLSLGGMVASWMAIDAPHRVDRLILASTIPRALAASPRALFRGFALTRCLAKPGREADVCMVSHILSSQFHAAHPDRVREIESRARAVPAKRRNLVALALAAARHSAEPELERVTAKTLLLFGALDPIAGQASEAELLRELPRASLEIAPGAGHDLSLEQPRETADRILRFLG